MPRAGATLRAGLVAGLLSGGPRSARWPGTRGVAPALTGARQDALPRPTRRAAGSSRDVTTVSISP
jgi:hypothetical protein